MDRGSGEQGSSIMRCCRHRRTRCYWNSHLRVFDAIIGVTEVVVVAILLIRRMDYR